MSKDAWEGFVNKLIEEDPARVVGVVSRGPKFVFDDLDSADDLRLDYDVTILPPKKYFLPQYETMMSYDLSQPFSVKRDIHLDPLIVIGVHPYDLIAIQQMDKLYLDSHVDDLYLERKRSTVLIGTNIQNVADRSFAGSMGTTSVDTGYDIMLTDLGDVIYLEVGTEKGKALLDKYGEVRNATDQEVAKVRVQKETVIGKYERKVNAAPQDWPLLFKENYDSPIWEERASKCLACGSCTLVCPTCFCYDVKEEVDLNLKDGKRVRTWDGCLLREFTAIASGEVFRQDITERYRHRYMRKADYLPDRYDFIACVGCGRCATNCLPDIADPVDVVNDLVKGAYTQGQAGSLYIPQAATITRMEMMTKTETLFEIELDSGAALGHAPGQFAEVSIFGIGEAPISISSPPNGTNRFEMVVRNVGNVTKRLHQMSVGDKVGIRGPFGNGFEVKDLEGKHLLFIAGGLGIAPMRSLFNYVLNHRKDFGKVTILYGCKEPCEQLFPAEVASWAQREDIDHRLTVDSCSEGDCWEGDIGVITTLIPKVNFDPQNTIAIVVGPPIMYRFVNKDLLALGMPEENIIVSLERRMKCGVGKCGHCQMNGVYVCREGPVFNYKDVMNLPEAFT
jgi:sulfite reductase subunit B